jgi:hypothetical protein
MSFTILYAVLALLVLLIIFGVTYKIKGFQTAFITTGIAFVILTLVLVAAIYAIMSVMPN